MKNRCYNTKVHANQPWYKGCTMCDEWLNDMYSFYDWTRENMYEIEGEKTVHLDKDILVQGNKIYSPETCIFVPARINDLFGGSTGRDNGLPTGVMLTKNGTYRPYRSTLEFDTPEEAWEEYVDLKKIHVQSVLDEYVGKIPEEQYAKIYEAATSWRYSIAG